MKLRFKKINDNSIVATTDTGEPIEDLQKCTVSSSPDQETVMTLTVLVKKEKPDEQ